MNPGKLLFFRPPQPLHWSGYGTLLIKMKVRARKILLIIILSYHLYLYTRRRRFKGFVSRSKKRIFKWARYIPSVRRQITEKMSAIEQDFIRTAEKSAQGMDYYTEMPADGLQHDELLALVDKYLQLGTYKWQEGRVSGAVYNFDAKLIDLITTVYGKTSYTNPLHSDIFPGICKMEAEVVRMTANLFNGNAESCGTVCLSGTTYQFCFYLKSIIIV